MTPDTPALTSGWSDTQPTRTFSRCSGRSCRKLPMPSDRPAASSPASSGRHPQPQPATTPQTCPPPALDRDHHRGRYEHQRQIFRQQQPGPACGSRRSIRPPGPVAPRRMLPPVSREEPANPRVRVMPGTGNFLPPASPVAPTIRCNSSTRPAASRGVPGDPVAEGDDVARGLGLEPGHAGRRVGARDDGGSPAPRREFVRRQRLGYHVDRDLAIDSAERCRGVDLRTRRQRAWSYCPGPGSAVDSCSPSQCSASSHDHCRSATSRRQYGGVPPPSPPLRRS